MGIGYFHLAGCGIEGDFIVGELAEFEGGSGDIVVPVFEVEVRALADDGGGE